MLDTIKKIVKENDICVLATAADDRPHCSLMAYVTNADCSELYLVTHKESRKYQNVSKNPAVSLLVDTRVEAERSRVQAITLSGQCRPVADRKRKEAVLARFLRAHPHLGSFVQDPDAELLCVRLSSFLLLDGVSDAHYETLNPP